MLPPPHTHHPPPPLATYLTDSDPNPIPVYNHPTPQAFCILYKFFCMRLHEHQVIKLLEHGDSP